MTSANSASNGNGSALGEVRGELARITGRLDTTDARVDELRSSLTELAEYVAELQADEETSPPPAAPCWVDLDPAQLEQAWKALVVWVDQVLALRYPHALATIPPCWPAHPAMVEELSWLHQSWVAAFRHKSRRVRQAADFHDRDLPGVLARIHERGKDCRGTAGVVLKHQPTEVRDGPPTSPDHLTDTHRADVATAHRRQKREEQA